VRSVDVAPEVDAAGPAAANPHDRIGWSGARRHPHRQTSARPRDRRQTACHEGHRPRPRQVLACWSVHLTLIFLKYLFLNISSPFNGMLMETY